MSPKKRILRELSLVHEPGTTYSYVRPWAAAAIVLALGIGVAT